MSVEEVVRELRDMATYDCGFEEQSDTAIQAADLIESQAAELYRYRDGTETFQRMITSLTQSLKEQAAELSRLREAERWVPDVGAALAELDEWIEATGCIAVGTSWHSELRWLFEQYLTLPTGPEEGKDGDGDE